LIKLAFDYHNEFCKEDAMKDRKKVGLENRKGIAIVGCIVASGILLASLLFVWKVQAADRAFRQQDSSPEHTFSTQDTIKIEFYYNGDDPAGAASAAADFADLLSQETELTIEASVHNCEAAIVNHLGIGQADVATLGSYGYAIGNSVYGFQARLINQRFDQAYYASQINVPADQGYPDITQLENKRFAMSNPGSVSGEYVPYIMILNETGETPDEFFSEVYYAGGHSQVIRDVYNGYTDCGATFQDARASVVGEYPDVYDKVDVLLVSDPIPNDSWAFRAGLDAALVQKLSDGIIAVAGTPQGETALTKILGSGYTGIETTNDSAYDIIREIVSKFGIELQPCISLHLPVVLK
jgi:phosphonate transport system substrate-binding protein